MSFILVEDVLNSERFHCIQQISSWLSLTTSIQLLKNTFALQLITNIGPGIIDTCLLLQSTLLRIILNQTYACADLKPPHNWVSGNIALSAGQLCVWACVCPSQGY